MSRPSSSVGRGPEAIGERHNLIDRQVVDLEPLDRADQPAVQVSRCYGAEDELFRAGGRMR
jgi:hypothetical protein